MNRLRYSIIVCLLAGLGFASGANAGKLQEFNYGIPTGVYSVLYVADHLGLFAEHGLKPNFYSFQSGAPLLAGLKSGSLDVVTTGLASVFAMGKNIPLKFIVWEGDAAQAEALVARKGVAIDSVKDLPRLGKIGAPTGTCAQISLYHAAKAAGMDYNDLDVVNVAPPLYRNTFLSEALDAGVAWGPYSLALQAAGHQIIGFDPAWVPGGGACPEMTIATEDALEEIPELGRKLVAVHAEALAEIERDPELAIDALVRRLDISEPVARAVFERYFADYPTVEKQLNPESRYAMVGDRGLVAQLDLASKTFVELGVLQEPIPLQALRDAVDASYLRAYQRQHQQQ